MKEKIETFLRQYNLSRRATMLVTMMIFGVITVLAQNGAGDYSAGTDALTQVTTEIVKCTNRCKTLLCNSGCGCSSRCNQRVHCNEQRRTRCQEEDYDDRRCVYLPDRGCTGIASLLRYFGNIKKEGIRNRNRKADIPSIQYSRDCSAP